MALVRVAPLAVVASLGLAHPALAQRTYLVELGAAGSVMSFSDSTNLKVGPGGLVRLGLWLPLRFSLDGEGSLFRSTPKGTSVGLNVRTIAASLLYNVMIGQANSFFLKAGVGSTTYGSQCPTVGIICGTATTWLGGLGFRIGITPILMVRADGALDRNIGGDTKFSNVTGSLGLSVMLGSRTRTEGGGPVPVGPPTPTPFPPPRPSPQVREPAPAAATTALCHDTPPGAVLDVNGCPVDSDGDGVPDGIDQCPDTPQGATVDALGCPADSDGDGVLDGLDRCPNTPPGTPVDAFGCPLPAPRAAPRPPAARTFVLRDNAFAPGTARLRPSAGVTLDSVAALLTADSTLRVEIGTHTARSQSEVDTRRFARLRLSAIRSYLIGKDVRPERLVPRFYGAAQPLTTDTSATGRATNRRVEIKALPGGW